MKQKVVSGLILSLLMVFHIAGAEWEDPLSCYCPLRCISYPHEGLHATSPQATDPWHLASTLPEEFRPATGQPEAEPGVSTLCRKISGPAELPPHHSQPIHHSARCPCPPTSHQGPGLRLGHHQESTHGSGGEGHRWLWDHELSKDCEGPNKRRQPVWEKHKRRKWRTTADMNSQWGCTAQP